MKLLKQYQFWVCLLIGIILFVGTYPFTHDMYIPVLFTVICICLNAVSSVLFAVYLYFKWLIKIDADARNIFLGVIIFQAIGHVIFLMMNWGSWLFLALSLIVLILFFISYIKEKRTSQIV